MNFDKSHANGGGQVAVAIRTEQTTANGHGIAEDVSHTLDGANGQAVAFQRSELRLNGTFSQVRRLTPRECERLQGFPDDYTRIPGRGSWRAMDETETPEDLRLIGLQVKQNKFGKWRVNDPDGPRYKALGNSMAVPVMRWLGERIDAVNKI